MFEGVGRLVKLYGFMDEMMGGDEVYIYRRERGMGFEKRKDPREREERAKPCLFN